MATSYFENFGSGKNPTVLLDYLPTLSSRFTKVSDTRISVNNGDAFIDVTSTTISIIVNGNTIFTTTNTYRGFYVQSIISDRFIFFHSAFDPNDPYFCFNFGWLLDDNNNPYVGYYYKSSGQKLLDISLLTFINVSTGGTGYMFPKLINFTAPVGSILYSSISPFINNGNFALFVKDIYSCSTVAINSTIALPTGDTFVSIGTNTMVKLDQ